jgi:hypothetical protein
MTTTTPAPTLDLWGKQLDELFRTIRLVMDQPRMEDREKLAALRDYAATIGDDTASAFERFLQLQCSDNSLFAAAPDLLDVCKAMVGELDQVLGVFSEFGLRDQLRAAIDKAEGKS